jgi:hypothetical protein
MFYVIYVFIRALKNRSPGAIIIFSSSIVLGITVTNDILFYNEIIQTGDFTSLGLFIFILGQSFTLGITYANTFKKVESITLTLTDLNNTLEEKVRIRTAELQRSQDELKVANNKLKELSNMDSLTMSLIEDY